MLLSVIFIMLILSGLMAATVTLSGQSSRQLVYEVQALKARLAAEAVLERKVYDLLGSFGNSAAVSTTIAGCEGKASGSVPTINDGVTQVRVIATGTCTGSGLTVVRNIGVEVIE
ncbi:hypothetical protein PU634_08005 [Oceanimonas pelagia]|uniref:MSHA biogenesis protein MshP n=1 Tax=Oceanimonas pelagia TaxID=3028314 RepID=A0AA50QBR6_9GAMM|nr:hypothetical protein [Oceanimonas pelagia]WMC12293.1 hypothetical protein PU634_08005 [Oceanimonas pelagia]